MSEPSKQDHWVRLALELGLPVPEDSGPKEPSAEVSPGSASEESLHGASSEGPEQGGPTVSASPKVSGETSRQREVRPVGPEKAAAPVGPQSRPGQGTNHWLEVAKQLGVELPPEKQSLLLEASPPSEVFSPLPAGQPVLSESKAAEAPIGTPSGERITRLPEKGPRSASEPFHPKSSEGLSEAGGAIGSEPSRSEPRKEKRRRKKHRRSKPHDLVHREKSVPSREQAGEVSEEENVPPISEGFSLKSALGDHAGLISETQEGPPTAAMEDQAMRSEADLSELSDRAGVVSDREAVEAGLPEVPQSGRGEETSAGDRLRGSWPEGRGGEILSAEGLPEWMEEGVEMLSEPPSPLERTPEEPILLPPPAEPHPSALGTEEAGSSEAISGISSSSAVSAPSEISEPISSFVESEEILPPEDLFDSTELQEQEEEDEEADLPSKQSGPSDSEKQIHRGVPTWKEVMDLIISTNLQARSRRGDRSGSHGRGGSSRSGH